MEAKGQIAFGRKKLSKTTADYWNGYYSQKELPAPPSQFAAFVVSEFAHKRRFVDIGCGDGRDSLFFAHYGMEVLGLDGSSSAISFCQNAAKERELTNVSFETLQIDDAAACVAFADKNRDAWAGAILYARFFLHAIDETAELNFLKLAADLIGEKGNLCLEFRTPRDEFQTKVTSAHFRRYVDPLALKNTARGVGLDCRYLTEGFGFAKYKSDDAYVARLIFEKV